MSASDGGWKPLWFSPGGGGVAAARSQNRRRDSSTKRTSTSSFNRQRRGDGTTLRRGESPLVGKGRRPPPQNRRASDAAAAAASAGPADYERSRSDYDPHRRQSSGSSAASTTFGGGSSHQRGAASRKQQQQRPPPILTVILMRLEASIASYCSALSKPGAASAAGKAARILEGSLYPHAGGSQSATDATTTRSLTVPPQQSSSPLSNIGTWARRKIPPQRSGRSGVSPSSFPSGNLSVGAVVPWRGRDPALEAEWQQMVDPLTLLAGAEGWYGGLEHLAVSFVSSSDGSKSKAVPASSDGKASSRERIRGIYGKITKDLIILKEILCDPMISGSEISDPTQDFVKSPPKSGNVGARGDDDRQKRTGNATPERATAESLAEALTTLAKLCHVRQKMIVIHSDMIALGSSPKEAGGNAQPAGVAASQLCLLGLADRCEEVLIELPKDCASSAAAPMVEAMRHEVAATKAALRMMAHLETCSFFETVINMKRLETCLGPSSQMDPPCSLEMWLRQMLREGLSLMAVYYDRVDAYANSSFGYGFQKHIMIEEKGEQEDLSKVSSAVATAASVPSSPPGSPTASSQGPASSRKAAWYGHMQDLDSEVLDFLHVHEERNGPDLAVTLFLDTRDDEFERGFCTKSTSSTNMEMSSVYLRTSTKSGNPDFENTLVGGNAASLRRSGARRVGPKGMSMTSLSNLLSSGGDGGLSIKRPSNTSRGSLASIVSDASLGLDGSEVTTNMGPSAVVKSEEYGFRTNSDAEGKEPPPWPHSEMSGMISIMRDSSNLARGTSPRSLDSQSNASTAAPFNTPRRLTRRNPFDFSPLIEETEEPSFDGSAIASPVRSITAPRTGTSPTSPSSPILSSPSGGYHPGSSHHFIQVQGGMWLSVIVKGEDEGGRTRRRTGGRGGLTDEEIRMWLNQFAAKLQTSRLYGPKSVASARKVSKGLSLPAQATAAVSKAGLTRDGKEFRWKDSEAADILVSLKETFGLQSAYSPLAARPLKSPYLRKDSKKFGGARRSASSLLEDAAVQDEASAAAFFLGADIISRTEW